MAVNQDDHSVRGNQGSMEIVPSHPVAWAHGNMLVNHSWNVLTGFSKTCTFQIYENPH
jgi:hypothetical protein